MANKQLLKVCYLLHFRCFSFEMLRSDTPDPTSGQLKLSMAFKLLIHLRYCVLQHVFDPMDSNGLQWSLMDSDGF